MKHFFVILIAVALVAPGCKKKKEESAKTPTETATKPADPKPADPKPADPTPVTADAPAIPEVTLGDDAAANMIAVMAASVTAIETAKPAEAAAILEGMLTKYNVEELRVKAKAAKDAGKGADKKQIDEFVALKEKFKKRAEELGKEDAEAIGTAAAAWSKAWGII